jgi:hypothetical protein
MACLTPLCSAADTTRVFDNGLNRIIIDDAELATVDFQAGA